MAGKIVKFEKILLEKTLNLTKLRKNLLILKNLQENSINLRTSGSKSLELEKLRKKSLILKIIVGETR